MQSLCSANDRKIYIRNNAISTILLSGKSPVIVRLYSSGWDVKYIYKILPSLENLLNLKQNANCGIVR